MGDLIFETVDDQVGASASLMEALRCKTVGDQLSIAYDRSSLSMRIGRHFKSYLKPQQK